MQSTWSNDTNECDISHVVVTGGGGGGGGPTASFSYTIKGKTAQFKDTSTDSSGTITSHLWTFGDGTSSNSVSPSHTYSASGTYSVTEKVTDNNNASSTKTASVTVH